MQKAIGVFIVFLAVFGGYLSAGGLLVAIWQPAEIVIIMGAGLGALLIANPPSVLRSMLKQIKDILKKSHYTAAFNRELLVMLYELLEMVKSGGLRVLDQHIEEPKKSLLFQKYPLVLEDKQLVTFISDNFRLMAMGKINEHEIENILEQEIDAVEEQLSIPAKSVQRIAEAMPGFGICAAVLGIIITMQSIDGSIALIGIKVSAALVGTFLGVFMAYCFLDPLSNAMAQQARVKFSIMECVKTVLVNHVAGKPSLLAVDAGRKMLPLETKPTFAKLDAWISEKRMEII